MPGSVIVSSARTPIGKLSGSLTSFAATASGVRSFGLAHVTADDLLWAFPDLEDGAVQCLPGCEHVSAEAGCHLDQWVAEGHSTLPRLAAFRQLLVSR